jgi:hypothetical protein
MSTTATRSQGATTGARIGQVDMNLGVITIPVANLDRAKEFYGGVGWRLDADFSHEGDRAIQFTPPSPSHDPRCCSGTGRRHDGASKWAASSVSSRHLDGDRFQPSEWRVPWCRQRSAMRPGCTFWRTGTCARPSARPRTRTRSATGTPSPGERWWKEIAAGSANPENAASRVRAPIGGRTRDRSSR